MEPGNLIIWKQDDDDEINSIGIIISHEIMNYNDPKLRISNMFLRIDERDNKTEVETTTVLWFNDFLPPYLSTNHKVFIETWYEVVNDF